MSRPTRASIDTCLRALIKEKEMQYKRGYIRLSALVSIKSQANTLSRLIGHRLVNELTNYELEHFFNQELREVEKSDGSRGYKDSTIKNLHNTLKQTYDLLERQGKLRRNPFTMKVRLYKLNDRAPTMPYDIEEIKAVMSLKDDGGILEGFLFACREGLRPCELIALTESNVCLTSMSSTILIDKSIVLGEFNKPKTDKSNRRICITQASRDILANMIDKPMAKSKFELKGITYSERFIFVNPETATYWQSSQDYYKSLKYYFEKAGVLFRGIQPCRHTYATTAINSGLPIVDVANHLGHSSVDTTMKHYRDVNRAVLGRHTLAHREQNDPYRDLANNTAMAA
ncbi:TPA: tyrosine-type recombinase/integrase [Vibrio parahaemolyticus]|uniref:tyrosine-type recombinase/integrase n=1 Tax=Vibrio parahaemolyticus TaxID=670 RepID=UPI0003F993FE|nr:site-specific integrase [Vibrio parahaemolyticus]